MIQVRKIDGTTFQVTVTARVKTDHTVTVDPSYHEKITAGRVSVEALVEKSFEFLLEREPNTSILKEFDLPTINRYFPEYEGTIRKML